MTINLSVVIINYNNEKFIEQCIESVIKQSMKDIEILVIDDGSKDKSVQLIKQIVQKYPYVKSYFQSNRGPGAARNKGLAEATGKYIMFLDSDDFLEENSLKKLLPIVESESADTLIANIRCFNEDKKWFMAFAKEVFKQNTKEKRHIRKNPELHLTASASNKLFKREFLIKEGITFDTTLRVGEDLLFTQKALFLSKYTVVNETVLLNYRVREGTLSKEASPAYFQGLVDLQHKLKEFYIKNNLIEDLNHIERRQLKFFANSLFNKIVRIQDYVELVSICKNFISNIVNIDLIVNELEEKHYQFYQACMHHNNHLLEDFLQFLYEQKHHESYILINDQVYSSFYRYYPKYGEIFQIRKLNLTHRVEILKMRNNKLTIGGYAFIENLDSQGTIKELVFKSRDNLEKVIRLDNTLRTDISYLYSKNKINYNLSGFETVEIDLPSFLGNGSFDVYFRLTKGSIVLEEKLEIILSQLRNSTKSSTNIMNSFLVEAMYSKGKYLSIQIRESTINTRINFLFKKLKKDLRYDLSFLKKGDWHTFTAILIYKLFNKLYRYRKIWLIGERRDTAQDNSFYLYKFIRNNYPKTNAYYLIDSKSKDYEKVAKYKKIVKFGTLKHTLYLLTARKTLNSYLESSNMYTEAYKNIVKYYPEWQRNEKIFLQHGVIGISRVNHTLHKNRMNYSKFIVSSIEEKKLVIEEFGYNKDEVIVTGLARWDGLQDDSKGKNVLLMPTWRKWIDSNEKLLDSEYYNMLMSFLKNKKLHYLLDKYNFILTFYPHFHIQKYLGDFPDIHEKIKLVRFDEESVQNLLKENGLLITDYSSVSEDFKVMNKPVIYYQFDEEDFFSKHYNRGLNKAYDGPDEYRFFNQEDLLNNLEEIFISMCHKQKTQKKKNHYCQEIYKRIKDVEEYENTS